MWHRCRLCMYSHYNVSIIRWPLCHYSYHSASALRLAAVDASWRNSSARALLAQDGLEVRDMSDAKENSLWERADKEVLTNKVLSRLNVTLCLFTKSVLMINESSWTRLKLPSCGRLFQLVSNNYIITWRMLCLTLANDVSCCQTSTNSLRCCLFSDLNFSNSERTFS